MTTLALIITIVGASLILSRAPLVFAPVATRETYKHLFDTPMKMRLLGAVFAAVAAWVYWLTMNEASIAGQVVRYFAGFIAVIGFFAMVLFPKPMKTLALNTWDSFSPVVLRGLGAIAVAFGAWLVYYGLTM